MFSAREFMASPSPSSLFAAYASFMASMMLARTILNDLIPKPIRAYLVALFRRLFKAKTSQLTLVIEENGGGLTWNEIFDAAELYLSTKIGPHTDRLKIDKCPGKKRISIRLDNNEKLTDSYEGIELKWEFVCVEQERGNNRDTSRTGSDIRRFFELSFDKKRKEKILSSYVPYILEKAKEIRKTDRVLKMFTLGRGRGSNWESINLEHPSTFETLAMEPEQKEALKEDLVRFLSRKEFYKRVGRAWKRGYLLYGPPGTGKSSLVAAMANYLKFDVYDLQLSNIVSDSDLRKLLLVIASRSILVIEDIDCSIDLPDRLPTSEENSKNNIRPQLTLSGLLNFIDGLWSSCGDERIIIFTTNHVEKLDPALLRPGRMDMHIHMSYCTFHGFVLLASNYLGISEADLSRRYCHVLEEIKGLIAGTKVTPAEVAEEFMKNEDPEVALDGIAQLFRKKKMEGQDLIGAQETERQTIED
ncbi:AAA-ATPase At5g17760-like [Punica granatum]|uniref:AAA-ATPase At5g17760-like n=1 Tax=Punica granatum TaxID=22663 RepID=A0A218XVH2_PUNGR|nr:AAA-ATPase At5g17760-like [Punica granatum]OWM88788.1 hypothetical protein CDL15_Pgr020742 [Punica granatum]